MPMTLAKEIFTGSFTSQCQVPRQLTWHRQKGFRLASDYSRSDSDHRISRDFLPGDPAVNICRNCLTSALRILLKQSHPHQLGTPTRAICLTSDILPYLLSYLRLCLTRDFCLTCDFYLTRDFCLTSSVINRGHRSRPVTSPLALLHVPRHGTCPSEGTHTHTEHTRRCSLTAPLAAIAAAIASLSPARREGARLAPVTLGGHFGNPSEATVSGTKRKHAVDDERGARRGGTSAAPVVAQAANMPAS